MRADENTCPIRTGPNARDAQDAILGEYKHELDPLGTFQYRKLNEKSTPVIEDNPHQPHQPL